MARKRVAVVHAPWRSVVEEERWHQSWRKSDASIRAALQEPRSITTARAARKKLKKLRPHKW